MENPYRNGEELLYDFIKVVQGHRTAERLLKLQHWTEWYEEQREEDEHKRKEAAVHLEAPPKLPKPAVLPPPAVHSMPAPTQHEASKKEEGK